MSQVPFIHPTQLYIDVLPNKVQHDPHTLAPWPEETTPASTSSLNVFHWEKDSFCRSTNMPTHQMKATAEKFDVLLPTLSIHNDATNRDANISLLDSFNQKCTS